MEYAVIMAGGEGKRLWPLSRQSRPKQMLKILDGQTLLNQCFDRLSGMFDRRNILIITNAGYADLVRENLPYLPAGNVIAEPAVRDTAGAIGLAASVLTKYDPDATMAVMTADHIIRPTDIFQQTIKDGLAYVNRNPEAMITFGIEPTGPNTQLGYIKLGTSEKCLGCENKVAKVEAFKEKPNAATAQEYYQSGRYCWNSGMFVWKASTVLGELFKSLPESQAPLKKIQADWDSPYQEETLKTWFPKLPKISIDYAVMEKAAAVYAIRLNCRWLDMGSFAALADIISSDENNNVVVAGTSQLIDCKNNIIITEDSGHLIAAMGLKNMVVAHSPDATLVCPIDDTVKLKEMLELIRNKGGEKYL
ncbi:MAG: sugar phosphate nucleotidyltransferase [Sedimentisphaerales bacterium]|nr:sugar phosphate nucleotidyltransferase [Sedimentisphaerales bacterium]